MLTFTEASRIQSKPRRHPERAGMGHRQQGKRGKDRPGEKIGAASAERTPGSVAHVTDNGLDNQSGERRGQPEQREGAFTCPQILIDGGHIPHLQSPAKLDPEKSETHVPDLPEVEARLVHRTILKPQINTDLHGFEAKILSRDYADFHDLRKDSEFRDSCWVDAVSQARDDGQGVC